MKKIALLTLITVITIACTSKKQGSMLVQGEVKGLKKGTLYLQKVQDTLLVSVDSVKVTDNGIFKLSDNVESPEIYYLNLNNQAKNSILFFGEKGTITINTKLEKFNLAADISGSKNHELLESYTKMAKKFSDKRLDLIKATFEAQKENDTKLASKLDADFKNLIKRRYYYTTNFAITNKNFEVAPYLALTELFDANVKLLDTVNNSISNNVKASKYGKRLAEFIKERKSE